MKENDLQFAGNLSESKIVQRIAACHESEFLKLGGGSFCHKVVKALQRVDLLVENAGHDCLPPDFYSDKLNIMFDVMRVNDSEKKKGYNPMFQEMSKLMAEAESKIKALGLDNVHTVFADLEADNSLNYDEIHQFKYYKRQVVRVLKEHIKKLHIWQSEHPAIQRKGFVIYDEAGMYFQGYAKPVDVMADGIVNTWAFALKQPVVHFPWMDEEFMRPLLDADLDFVVWYRPYVAYSDGNLMAFNGSYPYLAVIDVRGKISLPLQQYEVSDDWFSWQ